MCIECIGFFQFEMKLVYSRAYYYKIETSSHHLIISYFEYFRNVLQKHIVAKCSV